MYYDCDIKIYHVVLHDVRMENYQGQSLRIIEHFHLPSYFIPKAIKKVVGLKHMTQEALNVQNGYKGITVFEEIHENMVIILEG